MSLYPFLLLWWHTPFAFVAPIYEMWGKPSFSRPNDVAWWGHAGCDGSKMSASLFWNGPLRKQKTDSGWCTISRQLPAIGDQQDPAMVLYWSNTHIEQGAGSLLHIYCWQTRENKGGEKKVATFSSSFYDYFLTIPLFFISWKKWNDTHAIGSETSNFPANFILQWHVRLFSIDIGAEPKKE